MRWDGGGLTFISKAENDNIKRRSWIKEANVPPINLQEDIKGSVGVMYFVRIS